MDSPEVDAGPIPCQCDVHNDYCLLDSKGGDPDQMWEEYHCILRVVGVVYKRNKEGKLIRHIGGKPTECAIQRRDSRR